MAKYRRDDKTFREQITKLADAGLVLGSFKKEDYPAHIGQACSLYRVRPCSECAEPANFNGVPAYVRTIEPQPKSKKVDPYGVAVANLPAALCRCVHSFSSRSVSRLLRRCTLSEYTARDWQNGKPCPQHTMPYCTPCFKALVSMSGENPYKERQQEAFDALRANIMDRIIGRTNDMLSGQEFYRPKTHNFFLDSRKRKFAASCQLAMRTS